jgi:hypothetical protein
MFGFARFSWPNSPCRFAAFCLALLIAAFTATSVTFADTDSALEQRFRDEYPAASQRLEAFYSICQMTAVRESPACKGPQCTKSKTRFDYVRNGGHYKLLARYLLPPQKTPTSGDQQSLSDQFTGRAGAALIGDEGAFKLCREDAAEAFDVHKADSNEQMIEVVERSFPPACVPYYLCGKRLFEFMQAPEFKVEGATWLEAAGEPLARIEWESSVMHPKDGLIRFWGWVSLSPTNGWVIRETCVSVGNAEFPHAHTTTVQIGYDGKLEGMPILKTISVGSESGAERKKSEPTTWQVMTFSREAPLGEFTLSSLGARSE